MPVLLGAIADDFTGATDLASTLVKAGMPVIQTFGVPDKNFVSKNAAAIIVALKSRSTPVEIAVKDSLEALEWLKSIGVRQFFFKYCSTFDSTEQGNIGPVADAISDNLGVDFAIACPAFPTNGRTIYKGHLFVADKLLSESSMKDHPLTPMNDANLVRFLSKQTKHKVGLVPFDVVKKGAFAVKKKYDQLRSSGHRYAIVDAIDDENLSVIGAASKSLRLITGGSGVALGLPDNFRRSGELQADSGYYQWKGEGRAAVLSGSCSAMTRAQIAAVQGMWPNYCLDPRALAKGKDKTIGKILAWIDDLDHDTPFLVFSSADPVEVAAIQQEIGRDEAGFLVENAMATIAESLLIRGIKRLVVAGGETSGAVVKRLGITGLQIGKEIDPGVPWCRTIGKIELSLALKSGNFGNEDFFTKALKTLG